MSCFSQFLTSFNPKFTLFRISKTSSGNFNYKNFIRKIGVEFSAFYQFSNYINPSISHFFKYPLMILKTSWGNIYFKHMEYFFFTFKQFSTYINAKSHTFRNILSEFWKPSLEILFFKRVGHLR